MRPSVKEFGDERDGGENKRTRRVQKRGFQMSNGEPVWNFIFNTHKHRWARTHTHTNTKPSEVWNVVWPPQIFAPVLSWRCSSLLAFKCHSLPVFTSLTLFCLWICLNLFRMHLDILTPGCIGEIEGMRMRESHRNREWLREKSHRYWARWQANKGRKGKKGQTQTEVQKIFHTLELKWLNARAQRALTHYRWRIKVHFCISGKRSCQVVWTSFTCFCERPFSTLHPKHLYRATGTCRGGGGGGGGAPAPLSHEAQSALLSRQFKFFFFFIKHPSVKACPI